MNPQITLSAVAINKIRPSTRTDMYLKEAVLFYTQNAKSTKSSKNTKPNANLISIGSSVRASTGRLFDKWKNQQYQPLKENTILTLYDQRDNTKEADEICYYGLGDLNKIFPANRSKLFRLEGLTERFRMAGGDLVREFLRNTEHVKPTTVTKGVIDISNLSTLVNGLGENTEKITAILLMRAFVEGMYLGGYTYDRLKNSDSESGLNKAKTSPGTKKLSVEILVNDSDRKVNVKTVNEIISTSKFVASGVERARNLVNTPPNLLNTTDFANIAREVARTTKSICRVYTKSELKRMGMNAILGVNAGSHHEAKLVVMEYRGSKSTVKKPKIQPKILLVGKGVLFDSGGLSLKPSNAMVGMKMDMAGAAAVLGSFEALVRKKTSAHVVAIMPITDNMTGPDALKVGDVLTTYSGKTVEVLNTDAEGRLILSDALSFGIKTYKPNYIVDLATLTGAALVALGTRYAGLFTQGDEWANTILDSSKSTDEPLWRLPLDDQYLGDLQSDIADLKNIGGPYGGSITAAKFLEQFVPEQYRPCWAHLDIAPVMEYSATKGYQIKGATGFGVRLLVHLVESLSTIK